MGRGGVPVRQGGRVDDGESVSEPHTHTLAHSFTETGGNRVRREEDAAE